MTLIAFNKPFGVLSQFPGGKEGADDTLAHLVDVPGVYPAGRLDKDSEGLLLLTDDGRLQARIAEPRHKMPKTYLAQVEGEVGAEALDRLAQISFWRLTLCGAYPLLLGSALDDRVDALIVDLTNPRLTNRQGQQIPPDVLHFSRVKFLYEIGRAHV